MPRNLTLLILGLWAASSSVQAGNKIIPYLIQAPEFRTWITIINLCDAPASYRIDFKGSYGERVEFAWPDGKLWQALRDDIAPRQSHSFSLRSQSELRQGYGEITDDSGGCVVFEIYYTQTLPDGSNKQVRILPRQRSETGVSTFFLVTDTCDTSIAIAGDGGGVSLEALNGSGELLAREEIENVHHEAFAMKDLFPFEETTGGMLDIKGNVNVVAMFMCDEKMVSAPVVHTLPSTVKYEVVGFETRHLESDWMSRVYGHKYAYRLTIRNPTQKDLRYEAEIICRDQEGFVVARADIAGSDIFSPPLLEVPAGQTQTFEDTVDRGLKFETDPDEITVEVAVKVYRPWWE